MKITIASYATVSNEGKEHTSLDVTVEGEGTDTPEQLVNAYWEVMDKLNKEEE